MNALRGIGPVILISGMVAACGGGSSSIGQVGSGSSSGGSTSGSSGSSGITSSGAANVQPINVNFGPTGNYGNGIFTSVTICAPGTSNCLTIPNILVDSGSEGLRILDTEISSSLAAALAAQTNSNGNQIGECTVYGDSSYTWGPVTTADIQIGGETADNVPINIFGQSGTFTGNFSSFPAPPQACSIGLSENDNLQTFGAYGILGIGTAVQDCGALCVTQTENDDYFACGSSCTSTTENLADQVQNPVPYFATDNNGVIIELPAIPSSGQASASGSLVFGIGTESNNALGSAQVVTVDDNDDLVESGSFNTENSTGSGSIPGFTNPSSISAIIDSGSNSLGFPSSIPTCSDDPSFYCPTSTENYSALMVGSNGASVSVPFSVANADTLNGNNAALDDIAGPSSQFFDWGLPFFFGRNVYFAVTGKSASGLTGPYNAFISN